jgi:hypothetical protein
VVRRTTRTGFIKTFAVKKLDMERNKVNDSWMRAFHEKLFARDVFKAHSPNLPPRKDGKPRVDKSHLRKYIVNCNKKDHKFDGSYLVLEGHAERARIDRELEDGASMAQSASGTATKIPIESREDARKSQEELIRVLTENIRKNGISDVSSLLQGLGNGGGNSGGNLVGNFTTVSGGKRMLLEQPGVARVGPPPPRKKSRHFIDTSRSTSEQHSVATSVSDLSSASSPSDDEHTNLGLNTEHVANDLLNSPMPVSS